MAIILKGSRSDACYILTRTIEERGAHSRPIKWKTTLEIVEESPFPECQKPAKLS